MMNIGGKVMEKKVRYLMILLCLFLFPMKAFALEGTLEDTDDMVVVEENTNDENLFEEDLVKIENPNNIVLLGFHRLCFKWCFILPISHIPEADIIIL